MMNADTYHGHDVAGVVPRTGSRGDLRKLKLPYTTLLLTNGYKDFSGREVDWVFDPEHHARKEN
jgi:hypothetical protein